MTEQMLLVVQGYDELTPSQQIARRIREILAGNQIKGARMAPLLDLEVKAFNRRLRGEVDWSIDELSRLATALGVPFEDLVRHSVPGSTTLTGEGNRPAATPTPG